MLRRKGIGPALRALREVDIGEVHDTLVTLSCFDAELRYREALETMRFAPAAYWVGTKPKRIFARSRRSRAGTHAHISITSSGSKSRPSHPG